MSAGPMSNRPLPTAINSIAQHASPIGIGHTELVRIQFTTESKRDTMTSPSILRSYASSVLEETMMGRLG